MILSDKKFLKRVTQFSDLSDYMKQYGITLIAPLPNSTAQHVRETIQSSGSVEDSQVQITYTHTPDEELEYNAVLGGMLLDVKSRLLPGIVCPHGSIRHKLIDSYSPMMGELYPVKRMKLIAKLVKDYKNHPSSRRDPVPIVTPHSGEVGPDDAMDYANGANIRYALVARTADLTLVDMVNHRKGLAEVMGSYNPTDAQELEDRRLDAVLKIIHDHFANPNPQNRHLDDLLSMEGF